MDDNDALRGVAVRILRRRGYTVLEARDGEAGLHAMRAGNVDAVLTDLAMPGMDGPTMVAAIRASRPMLPIVVMSGCGDAASLTVALAGALFLAKPFTPQSLTDILARAFDADAVGSRRTEAQ
ncbi:MAG TPA: response regulator [Labilithrix sp.]|nr:response regulator [Labilithrix sp.]